MLYVLFMILLSSLFFVLSPHTKKHTQTTSHTMANRPHDCPYSCIDTHHPSFFIVIKTLPGGDSQRKSLPARTRHSLKSIPTTKIVAIQPSLPPSQTNALEEDDHSREANHICHQHRHHRHCQHRTRGGQSGPCHQCCNKQVSCRRCHCRRC